MDKIPFGVYDFLAYLSSGTALVLTADYLAGSGVVLRKEGVGANIGIILIFAAYILGHIVANISSWLYESTLVGRLLGSPSHNLMSQSKRHGPRKWIFPGYFKSLPKSTQQRIREAAAGRGCDSESEPLFLHCYSYATRNLAPLQSRLDDFRNQYGFARNVSCSLLLAAVAITIGWLRHPERVHLKWAFAALACCIGLLYRYLKFYRQYSFELLIRYSELPKTKDEAA